MEKMAQKNHRWMTNFLSYYHSVRENRLLLISNTYTFSISKYDLVSFTSLSEVSWDGSWKTWIPRLAWYCYCSNHTVLLGSAKWSRPQFWFQNWCQPIYFSGKGDSIYQNHFSLPENMIGYIFLIIYYWSKWKIYSPMISSCFGFGHFCSTVSLVT